MGSGEDMDKRVVGSVQSYRLDLSNRMKTDRYNEAMSQSWERGVLRYSRKERNDEIQSYRLDQRDRANELDGRVKDRSSRIDWTCLIG